VINKLTTLENSMISMFLFHCLKRVKEESPGKTWVIIYRVIITQMKVLPIAYLLNNHLS